MTALLTIAICIGVALTAAGYMLGAIVERRAWRGALERPRCFRCEGLGVEPRRKGRWAR